MSTSKNRTTPIDYMDESAANVLWSLRPQAQSDSGFHCGASISSLSQFAAEDEVLFPPCTLLQVVDREAPRDLREPSIRRQASRSRVCSVSSDTTTADNATRFGVPLSEQGKRFINIHILPCFV